MMAGNSARPLHFARGLFRLWLVFAGLWVAVIGPVIWLSSPAAPDLPDAPWASFDPDAYLATPKKPAFDPTQGYKPVDDWSPPTKPAFDPSKPYEVVTDLPKSWPAMARIGTAAFLPPALILAIGAGLIWAFRGFRP